MPDAERFLSVRIDPARERDGVKISWLVLEYVDGQWWMYFLDANQKIAGAQFCPDLKVAFNHASMEFQIEPSEWQEDRPN